MRAVLDIMALGWLSEYYLSGDLVGGRESARKIARKMKWWNNCQMQLEFIKKV